MEPLIEEMFHLLSGAVQDISEDWVVVLRMREEDPSTICWFVFPPAAENPEDLEESEVHPDRVLVTTEGGIMFVKPTPTIRSQWMAIQLRSFPELAGRII